MNTVQIIHRYAVFHRVSPGTVPFDTRFFSFYPLRLYTNRCRGTKKGPAKAEPGFCLLMSAMGINEQSSVQRVSLLLCQPEPALLTLRSAVRRFPLPIGDGINAFGAHIPKIRTALFKSWDKKPLHLCCFPHGLIHEKESHADGFILSLQRSFGFG